MSTNFRNTTTPFNPTLEFVCKFQSIQVVSAIHLRAIFKNAHLAFDLSNLIHQTDLSCQLPGAHEIPLVNNEPDPKCTFPERSNSCRDYY